MTPIFKFRDFCNSDVLLFSNIFLEPVRYLVLAGKGTWTEFRPWHTNSRRCLIFTYVLWKEWVRSTYTHAKCKIK